MSHAIIMNSLRDQFERSLTMFKAAIGSFPLDEWTKGELDYLRSAGSAYHVVESIEVYGGNVPVDTFNWGYRFGCDWEDPDSSKLPSQVQVLQYLDEIWSKTESRFLSSNPTQPETLFPWTGTTLHSRFLYLLRHIQHHTAEMILELKKRGYKCPEWK